MPIATYDTIAHWYDQQLRQGSAVHDLLLPDLLDLMADVQGRAVCDLACGQGVIARLLARRGAHVTGIDLAPAMLALAAQYEAAEPLGIAYQQDDAQALRAVSDASFDGVLCVLALVDIPDLAATCRTVRRILRPGGWFVLAITHPCYETPDAWWATDSEGVPYRAVRAYFGARRWFSTNPHGVRGQVGAYHRPLSVYLNTLIAAGLALERLVEPQASGPLAASLPLGYAVVPAMLLARCRAV